MATDTVSKKTDTLPSESNADLPACVSISALFRHSAVRGATHYVCGLMSK
jgi:hypothetical protein